jgi:hypothetical protein
MKKELPKIYSETIDRDTNHVVAYTRSGEKQEVSKQTSGTKGFEKSVSQKINEIFKSVNYVYKIDVVIQTNEGEFVKQIVGRNKNHIITMENEQIEIDKIKDIYIK